MQDGDRQSELQANKDISTDRQNLRERDIQRQEARR